MSHSQSSPGWYPPTQEKKRLSTGAIVAIVVAVVVVVIVIGAVIAGAFLSGVQQAANSTNQPNVKSATITVSCPCQPSLLGNYLFSGSIDDGTGSASVQGGYYETSHSWTLQRNGQTLWIFSWTIQANQADGTSGTMTVVVTLSTGQQVFDKSTDVQFGVVSGSYSVG